MQKHDDKKVTVKNPKKPYSAPKATELGNVQELTQLSKGSDCGSNVCFRNVE